MLLLNFFFHQTQFFIQCTLSIIGKTRSMLPTVHIHEVCQSALTLFHCIVLQMCAHTTSMVTSFATIMLNAGSSF